MVTLVTRNRGSHEERLTIKLRELVQQHSGTATAIRAQVYQAMTDWAAVPTTAGYFNGAISQYKRASELIDHAAKPGPIETR